MLQRAQAEQKAFHYTNSRGTGTITVTVLERAAREDLSSPYNQVYASFFQIASPVPPHFFSFSLKARSFFSLTSALSCSCERLAQVSDGAADGVEEQGGGREAESVDRTRGEPWASPCSNQNNTKDRFCLQLSPWGISSTSGWDSRAAFAFVSFSLSLARCEIYRITPLCLSMRWEISVSRF
jgi:hypothetical protein